MNPTMSLLQSRPQSNGLSLASKALSMSPKAMSIPRPKQAVISPAMAKYRQELADDILIKNTIAGNSCL